MRRNNFKKISIILTILILIITFILIIYTINYLDSLRKEFIGEIEIKMNCQENDSVQIKQILRDYYNDEISKNNISNHTIENIYNNDDLIIKSASTWMDFNNRKYKITYLLDGKNNKYEFTNDSIGKLYEYIQKNKIDYIINYKLIYIILCFSLFTLIIIKVILNFYKKPE